MAQGYKRSLRNYLLNSSYQLRFTAVIVVISAILTGGLGYLVMHNAHEASRVVSVRAMDPKFGRVAMGIFPAVQSNAKEEAVKFLEQGNGTPESSIWYLSNSAYVYGRTGNRKKAMEAISKLKALNARQRLDPGLFVMAYIGVGDQEQTIFWLGKALEQHSNVVTVLKVDPMYDPLRGDARFQRMLREVRLER